MLCSFLVRVGGMSTRKEDEDSRRKRRHWHEDGQGEAGGVAKKMKDGGRAGREAGRREQSRP